MGGEDSPLPLIYTQMSGNVNFIGTQEEWDALVEKNKLRLLAMKNQTALQWLIEQVHSDEYTHAFGRTYISIDLIDQAKALEKERIEAAYRAGYTDCSLDRFSDCEEYYNKNFNNTQS